MFRHSRGVIIKDSLCSHKSCRLKREHIFFSSAEKPYVLQFNNMNSTKREDNMLCIITNNTATLNSFLHRLHSTAVSDFVLFIISFILMNYILWVRLDVVKLGLLECPKAFLHLVTVHQPSALQRKTKRWNAYDCHPNNTVSKFVVSFSIYRRSMPLNLLSVWSPQPNLQLCVFICIFVLTFEKERQ
jgi:hypothetical protein